MKSELQLVLNKVLKVIYCGNLVRLLIIFLISSGTSKQRKNRFKFCHKSFWNKC